MIATLLRWIGAHPPTLADTPIMRDYANREREALIRGDTKALGRVRRHKRADLHQALWRAS